jgi:hypothetical protein
MYLRVLYKYTEWNVRLNGEKIKIGDINFLWYLNACVSVDNSLVRMVIGLASWVLGRLFGTGERESKLYVTGIVCWQQIVLGWLDREWEGKVREWGNCETVVEKIRWWMWREENITIYSLYLRVWNVVSRKISCGCLTDLNPRSNSTILIKFPEQTSQLQNASFCNCAHFLEDFRSPQLWSVSVGYPSLGYIEKARHSVRPVALWFCTVQIQVKLSVQLLQYHGLTASRWLEKWCSLYWVREYSSLATAEISNVSPNILSSFYNYKQLSELQTKILLLIFISLYRLTCTTNLIPLKSIAIFSTLLLTSPSYHQISPSAPYS